MEAVDIGEKIKLTTNYAPNWYWVKENGKVEDTIKGSKVKAKWKKAYKSII